MCIPVLYHTLINMSMTNLTRGAMRGLIYIHMQPSECRCLQALYSWVGWNIALIHCSVLCVLAADINPYSESCVSVSHSLGASGPVRENQQYVEGSDERAWPHCSRIRWCDRITWSDSIFNKQQNWWNNTLPWPGLLWPFVNNCYCKGCLACLVVSNLGYTLKYDFIC